MKRDFDRAVRKLEEAQLLLRELAEAWDDDKAHALFSAYLSASRSATFVLQACLASGSEFEAWWKAEQDTLRDDPLSSYFRDARNETEKLGIQAIHNTGVGTRLSTDGRPECSVLYRFRGLEKSRARIPEGDAVVLSQRHLNRLAKVLGSAATKFGHLGDQTAARLETIARARPPVPKICPLHEAMEKVAGRPLRLEEAASLKAPDNKQMQLTRSAKVRRRGPRG